MGVSGLMIIPDEQHKEIITKSSLLENFWSIFMLAANKNEQYTTNSY